MLVSLKLKDLLEMQLKIKLPETQLTPFLMQKDLLEENSKMILYKKILNYGHSKLLKDMKENHKFKFNSKEKLKNSSLKKFLQWS